MQFFFKLLMTFSILLVASQSFGQQENESFDDFDDVEFSEPSDQEEAGLNDPLLDEGEILDQIEELNKFSVEEVGLKPFIYSERGRKNPFKKPSGVKLEITEAEKELAKTSGLEGYDLESFQITAVLWDIKFPKALVKSPNNEIFQVEEGTKIGRNSGYVAKIREGEVVVIESTMPNGESGRKFYKTQVLKLGR